MASFFQLFPAHFLTCHTNPTTLFSLPELRNESTFSCCTYLNLRVRDSVFHGQTAGGNERLGPRASHFGREVLTKHDSSGPANNQEATRQGVLSTKHFQPLHATELSLCHAPPWQLCVIPAPCSRASSGPPQVHRIYLHTCCESVGWFQPAHRPKP